MNQDAVREVPVLRDGTTAGAGEERRLCAHVGFHGMCSGCQAA